MKLPNILDLRKIPASSDFTSLSEICFSSFNVSTDTLLSDKTYFKSAWVHPEGCEVLRKSSIRKKFFRKTSDESTAGLQKRSNKKKRDNNKSEASLSRVKSIKLIRKKREKPPRPDRKISGSFRLFADSVSLLRQHWKLFGGITLVYLVLNILLVGVLSGLGNFQTRYNDLAGEIGRLPGSIVLFGELISGNNASTTDTGSGANGVYQTIIVLIISLATIWALRQVLAGEKVRIRDSFYKGIYPLVPFVLVLLFVGLLFVPALIASFLIAVVLQGGLAVNILEKSLWLVAIILLLAWSVYMLVTRIFAVYIVTLPEMTPVRAIKSARRLAYWRRWALIRKLLFLPFAIFVIGAIILLPIITYIPVVAPWVFLILSMFAMIFVHTYAYSLYKELL